jgi:hypothetical protein
MLFKLAKINPRNEYANRMLAELMILNKQGNMVFKYIKGALVV